MASRDYEAIVVGGSFAGLAAALQLTRARRQVLVIDGGKPRNRFASVSHGFLGQDGKAPGEILEAARRQLLAYPTVEIQGGEATGAARDRDDSAGWFRVAYGEGHEARAKRLVLATGVVDHLPEVPGMRELWGDGVAMCPYCHGFEWSDRKLAVLAGMMGIEGAVHQASLLREWSGDITLLTNGAPNLTGEQRDQLRALAVTLEEAPIAALLPEAEGSRHLGAVEFEGGRRIPFGGMFTTSRLGLASDLGERLGCEIEAGKAGPMLKTDAFQETSVPGVFAAGDAARAMHSVTLAVADGMLAGVSAHRTMVFKGENDGRYPR